MHRPVGLLPSPGSDARVVHRCGLTTLLHGPAARYARVPLAQMGLCTRGEAPSPYVLSACSGKSAIAFNRAYRCAKAGHAVLYFVAGDRPAAAAAGSSAAWNGASSSSHASGNVRGAPPASSVGGHEWLPPLFKEAGAAMSQDASPRFDPSVLRRVLVRYVPASLGHTRSVAGRGDSAMSCCRQIGSALQLRQAFASLHLLPGRPGLIVVDGLQRLLCCPPAARLDHGDGSARCCCLHRTVFSVCFAHSCA